MGNYRKNASAAFDLKLYLVFEVGLTMPEPWDVSLKKLYENISNRKRASE